VEPRESARSAEERAAQKAGEEIMTNKKKEPRRARRTQRIFCSAVFALSAVSSVLVAAQTSKTRAHVETLASSRLEGRLAGSNGERLASDYIVAELQKIGAKPLPGQKDFLLPFEFTAGTKDGGSTLSLKFAPKNGVEGSVVFGNVGPGSEHAVRALSFSDNGDVEGPAVFAGYGIVVPESQGFAYDSYATLDVKDKIVVVLRYFPEDAEPKTKGILSRYADLRYKAMAARQHGAKAMIVVTGPNSPNAGELAPMTFDTAIAGSGIVAVTITGEAAAKIFDAVPDKPLATAQKSLDDANPHAAGFALPGITVTVHAAVEREKRTGHNVVAYLPATTPSATSPKPWVAIGAHYDHLGHGEAGNTLAGKEDAGKIHFGADDNASGSAAVLAIAATLAKQPRKRNVLVGFWSGEELGLIGSNAFATTPPVPLDTIAAYLNFDMVGRMQDNKLTVQATGSSPAWGKIIEQANVAAGFDLAVQEDPYQPTDVATFNGASIPSLSFFTGTHADYHKPSDTADKIDYEDLDRVVDFAAAIARRIEDTAEAPAFTKVDQQLQQGAGRAGVRIFTGTIPDYSTEVKGLLLGGVVGGGPAEQAGLKKGDVIVEIAGQTIANIYDYTYALDILKIGQPAKVIYMRDGKKLETTLTPGARK
jgi:Zn-dependent M28 family amino/carboxypeptidase